MTSAVQSNHPINQHSSASGAGEQRAFGRGQALSKHSTTVLNVCFLTSVHDQW